MSTPKVYELAFKMGAKMDSSVRTAFAGVNKQLGDAQKNSQEFNNKTGVLKTGLKGLAGVALAATTAIGGLTLGIGSAINKFDEYNGAMKQIQASTDSSIVNMAEMKELSTNLYNKNLGEDWNDLATSIASVQSVTKLSGKELEAATANAIVYRDVWGEEVSESIKTTDTMMRNFGISSTEAYNLLAQGAQKGLNKSDELLDSANEYAPYFNSLGFTANQMFDTFSAGLESGAFNLDKVGDAVKEFNIRAKDGSKETAGAFQALGMDAGKMSQIFARGGPEAQKSFKTVVQAISKVKDPVKQNSIAVSLFGTQAEDLEKNVIKAMGNARSQFDMTKDTMKEVQNIKYDTLGMAFQGIGRQIETGFIIPLGEKALPYAQKFSDYLANNMPRIKEIASGAFNKITEGIGYLGKGIQNIGSFFAPVFAQLSSFWSEHGSTIIDGFKNMVSVIGEIGKGIMNIFNVFLPYLMPIISKFVNFTMDAFRQVADFWKENGPQIIQAVQNCFNFIVSIIQFVAPIISFIVNSVFGNIVGVIKGALNIIMGAIKIFAGLFTGDFSKMWEGIKQLFLGAAQFLWNAFNLLFVGKIIGGIKSLATGAISRVSGMWTSIKTFFTNGASAVWQNILNLGPKFASGFSSIRDKGVSLIKSMWTKMQEIFGNIVQGAKDLPGKIGSGISSMAQKAVDGAIKMGNKLISGIGNAVNGVIGGLNWVMGKIGVNVEIAEWEVPQYARGTKGHPGGPAILGDGGGPELFKTPSGFIGLSPGTDTLINLPKGTHVIPAKETAAILQGMNVPAYKDGTGENFITAGFNKVKDLAIDVYSYIKNPSELFKQILKELGVSAPSMDGTFGDIASGVFKNVKDKALEFLKDKLNIFSSSGSGAPGNVSDWILQAMSITGVPLSWLDPLVTKAMKESTGNPAAINLWDSNAKKGTPSKGLMQTIDSTFNAYKLPGLDDIWNPVHNTVAAIRYIQARYGTVFNTPGIKSMANGGGYKGYYQGGRVNNSQWAWVGERGPELINLPGGSRVFSNSDSQSMLSNIMSYGEKTENQPSDSSRGKNETYEIVYSPQIIIQGNADEQAIRETIEEQYEKFKKFMQQFQDDKDRLELA